jgi:hypothetical protein
MTKGTQAMKGQRFTAGERIRILHDAGQRSDRQQQLMARTHAISAAHPCCGYRRIAVLRRQEGWPVGKRQGQRLRLLEERPRFGSA